MKTKNVLYVVLVNSSDQGEQAVSKVNIYEEILLGLDTADVYVFDVIIKRFNRIPPEEESEYIHEDITEFFTDPLDMGIDDDEDDLDETEKIIAESNKMYGKFANQSIGGFFLYICIVTEKELYDRICAVVHEEWFDKELDVSFFAAKTDYESFIEFFRQLLFPGSSKTKGKRTTGPIPIDGPSGSDLN